MKTSIFSLCLVGFCLTSFSTVQAQTLRRDYVVDAPIQYRVSDPWDRGLVFRRHIGHAGFFYNCDNEQCKRQSPYICFKSEHRGCRETCLNKWRRQIAEAKWRLDAGGCGCPNNYPGCDCEPGICLACNTHPGIPSIDYSKLPPGTATLKSKTPQDKKQSDPAPSNPNIERYRSGQQSATKKANSYFAEVPRSIDDQSRHRSTAASYYRSQLSPMPESSLPVSSARPTRLHHSIVKGEKPEPRTANNSHRNRLVPVADAIAAQKQKLRRSFGRQVETANKNSTKRSRLLR